MTLNNSISPARKLRVRSEGVLYTQVSLGGNAGLSDAISSFPGCRRTDGLPDENVHGARSSVVIEVEFS